MVLFFGIMFILCSQPLISILLLIFILFFYSFLFYGYSGVYWGGYLLMLVMLSGVLVLFSYMVSMTPNEKFEVKGFLGVVFFLMVFSMVSVPSMGQDLSMTGLFLWFGVFSGLILFLVIFLLVVMFMCIFFSNKVDGAVRV